MRVVRLSRSSPVPAKPPLATEISRSRLTLILPPLLALALTLTLLPLLLPTVKHHWLTFFTIRPIGYEREPSVAINGGSLENKAARWLGKDGPSIYVGALQVCSKESVNEQVLCTSSSKAASHAKPLPLHLPLTLLSLPPSPRTPILLLVSAILSAMAMFVLIAGLIKCSVSLDCLGRRPPLEPTPHRAQISDDDSVHPLADVPCQRPCIQSGRPHCSFFCLIVAALAMALGALIQLRDVHRAQKAWNNDDGQAAGLVFKLGALTYLLPVLPTVLIVILVIAASPLIHTSIWFQRRPADEEFTIQQPIIKITPAESSLGHGSEEPHGKVADDGGVQR